MFCLCDQEILGYHFTIVHRINKMMVNVYALTRSFGHLISHHIAIASLLSSRDHAKSNRAYDTTKFSDLGNVKITKNDKPSRNPTPLLISDALNWLYKDGTTNSVIASSLEPYSLNFIKKLPIQRRPSPTICAILPLHDSVTLNTVVAALHIPQYLKIICLCINDVVGSYTNWWRLHGNGPISWSLKNLFTSPTLISLLNILYSSDTPIMQTLQDFNSDLT